MGTPVCNQEVKFPPKAALLDLTTNVENDTSPFAEGQEDTPLRRSLSTKITCVLICDGKWTNGKWLYPILRFPVRQDRQILYPSWFKVEHRSYQCSSSFDWRETFPWQRLHWHSWPQYSALVSELFQRYNTSLINPHVKTCFWWNGPKYLMNLGSIKKM